MNGDFLGFTFITNGTEHKSQDLGIIRVSDGDRYKDQLIPEIEDKTIEIPGLDGSYLYGSDFKPRNFSISIAFDNMTEKQLRDMRTVFGYKQTGLLIFDEAPYKAYRVKVAAPPELNYVCFDERETELVNFNGIKGPTTVSRNQEGTKRIYKGDGTIEFVAYYPFAMVVHKTLEEYDDSNKSEWAEASGLKESLEGFDTYTTSEQSASTIRIYNPGDVETGFRLYVPFVNNQAYIELVYGTAALCVGTPGNPVQKRGNDIGFIIDTTNGLVRGSQGLGVTTNNLYNDYAVGSFFKLKPTSTQGEIISIDTPITEGITISYEYLYF